MTLVISCDVEKSEDLEFLRLKLDDQVTVDFSRWIINRIIPPLTHLECDVEKRQDLQFCVWKSQDHIVIDHSRWKIRQDHTALDRDAAAGQDVPAGGQSSTSTPSSNHRTNQDDSLEGNDAKTQKSDKKSRNVEDEAKPRGDGDLDNTQSDALKTPEDRQHLQPRYHATMQVFTGVLRISTWTVAATRR